MDKKLAYLKFLIIIAVLAGCKSATNEKFISEGIIEYTAVCVDKNDPQASVAPSKMTVKFKNNKVIARMNAGMGIVSISFVADPTQKKYMEMVKVFSDKSAHISDSAEMKAYNDSILPKIKVEYTEETKVIAGYNCKKANISYTDDVNLKPFSVYYTNEIDIKESNWSNEYSPIEGVLMEYQLDRFGLALKFTASKVTKSEVADEDFTVPSDYKLISKAQFEDIFKALQ